MTRQLKTEFHSDNRGQPGAHYRDAAVNAPGLGGLALNVIGQSLQSKRERYPLATAGWAISSRKTSVFQTMGRVMAMCKRGGRIKRYRRRIRATRAKHAFSTKNRYLYLYDSFPRPAIKYLLGADDFLRQSHHSYQQGWDNEKNFQPINIRPKNNDTREINKLYRKKKI
jgi:hypothetical protein